MQVKVNPGSMLATAVGLYFLLLLFALIFWPENWVDPSSVEIIIFSLGVVVGGMLVQILYQISFDDKQGEVDLYLSQSEAKIEQKMSELNLNKENLKERENFLLEAIDRLTPDFDEKESVELDSEESDEPSDEVDYDSMTVSQLKNILKDKELSISGKKSDLIARLKS
tara:strand:- start:104 stop:607 length:504 start_codon:yes stop_codon:yes gene_type:complete